MSCMRCIECGRIVDTDDDPDSLYIVDGECFCEHCRGELDLEPRWESNPHVAEPFRSIINAIGPKK